MNEQAAQGPLLPSSAPPPLQAAAPGTQAQRGDWLLAICRLFNFVTGLCALLCAFACGIALFLRSEAPTKDLFFYSGQCLRIWGIGISALVMLVEAEWQRFLLAMPILDSWLGRGLLQIFLATLTYREAYPRGESDLHKSLLLYRSVASVSMLACGTTYIFGALLCISAIKRARYRREEQLLQAQAEFQALEGRKKELERLLGRAPE